MSLINSLIPIEAGMAIVLWIGIIITAQAFQTTPRPARARRRDGTFPGDRCLGVHRRAGAFVRPAKASPGALTMQKALAGHPNLR